MTPIQITLSALGDARAFVSEAHACTALGGLNPRRAVESINEAIDALQAARASILGLSS